VTLVAENPEPVPLTGVGGTGLTVAGIRAAETERADRLFADPLAGAFVAAAGSPPSQATGRPAAALRLWVVARTVFLDELVLAACAGGVRQVVLLGAGFDTRAFRLPWPPGVRCLELDTPDVLHTKEQVLTAQHAVPGCERITVPGDLLDDWPAGLRAAALRPDEPTAWVAEGLLVCLSPHSVDALLERVTSLSAPGSRLGLTSGTARPPARAPRRCDVAPVGRPGRSGPLAGRTPLGGAAHQRPRGAAGARPHGPSGRGRIPIPSPADQRGPRSGAAGPARLTQRPRCPITRWSRVTRWSRATAACPMAADRDVAEVPEPSSPSTFTAKAQTPAGNPDGRVASPITGSTRQSVQDQ
jgi:methyltransferase (TIGR00027 family)